MIDYKLEL